MVEASRLAVSISPSVANSESVPPDASDVLVAWAVEQDTLTRVTARLADSGLDISDDALRANADRATLFARDGKRCLLVRPPGPSPFDWRRAGEQLCESGLGRHVALLAPAEEHAAASVSALVEALVAGAPDLETITIVGAAIDAGVVHARGAASALARSLTDEPASVMTPAGFAARAQALAEQTGLRCDVLGPDELESRGFGGLLGVGAGAEAPSFLVDLRLGEPCADELVIVGKAVTFDEGGVQTKDARTLTWMRVDMAGGAATLAAMGAARTLGAARRVRALIPCAENRAGVRAMRPGDVITHYDGSTTEVVSTDAEGRLILADAIALAAESNPASILTVATLTDPFALGPDLAAVIGTSDELIERVKIAGAGVGEPVWRMPLWPGYSSWVRSRRADRRNWDWSRATNGLPQANTIFAALFLSEFAGTVPFAHLDIVGPAVRALSSGDIAPTGYGAALLTELILGWAGDSHLDSRLGRMQGLSP